MWRQWSTRCDEAKFRTNNCRHAFTLLELLTVMFIIGLLIAILIPSLNGARNSAKKASTKSTLNSIKVGLESFKNDNGSEFRATNGYPPSFSHPPLKDFDNFSFAPENGEFPFISGNPTVYGAHWLPAMLLGRDANGYVTRAAAQAIPDPQVRKEPHKWYEPLPITAKLVDRRPLYLDPTALRLIPSEQLPGSRPTGGNNFFPDWGDDVTTSNDAKMKQLPVIADAFDQPILYYASNAFGGMKKFIQPKHTANNDYGADGQPYYFHQDNEGFTGNDAHDGWNFVGAASGGGRHKISRTGFVATAKNMETFNNGETFARYIVDRRALKSITEPNDNSPMKPVNPDTYLLISAGVDGIFGSTDDINNLPATNE